MGKQRAGWRILGLVAILSSVTLLISTNLFAQVDTGSVLGTVKDQTGAVIPGAKITLTDEGKGLSITTTSAADGSYSFSPVKIGIYTVTAEAQGFAKITQAHITVDVQQHVVVDLTLKPGAVSQTIEVTGAPPQLQTQEASVGQVVGAQTVNELPLNGRNFTFLAQIVAGVNTPQADTRGNAKTGAFAANGERPAQNNYLLDGIDNNSNTIDFLNGTNFVVLPPVDAIQEFKVQTSDYSAEQGRAGGAILNATVKSGTNELHGDVWEFFRNDKLDSADFFENAGGVPKGEFRQNQFGFTIGGPVVLPHVYNGRNKLFFFGDYEALRRRQGHVFGTNSVPTEIERNSNYTNLAEIVTNQINSGCIQDGTCVTTDPLGRSFPMGAIFDPATTRPLTIPCGSATGVDTAVTFLPYGPFDCAGQPTGTAVTNFVSDPFVAAGGPSVKGTSVLSPGANNFTGACPSLGPNCFLNQLPPGRIDPNAISILKLFPRAQRLGLFGNNTTNPLEIENRNGFDTRMDFNANDRNQIFGRYSFVDDPQMLPGPFAGLADGGAFQNGVQSAKSQQGALGWTRSLSPTTVNEARIGLTYIHTSRFDPEGTTFGIPSQYGITGGSNGNGDIPQVAGNGGLPAFSFDALSTLGTNAFLPSDEVNNTVQVTDNFSKSYGKHSFKMGFEFQHIKFGTLQPSWSHGQFNYGGTYTGGNNTGIAQLLLTPITSSLSPSCALPSPPLTCINYVGGADSVFASNIALVDDLHNYYGTYFQDDWKLTPKLTLNLGLRWEHFGLPEEVHGRQANFVPGNPYQTAEYLVPDSKKNRSIFATTTSFNQALCQDGIVPHSYPILPLTNPELTDCLSIVPQYDHTPELGTAQNLNFAPRFGMAYQITPKMVVRGGFGVFYGGFEVQNGNNQGNSFPYQFNFGLFSPNSNTPITVSTPSTLPAPCRQAFTFELGFTCTPLDPSLAGGFGVGLTGLQTNFQTPYSEGWNFTLEYAFTPTLTLKMGYVGNSTHHLEIFKGTNHVSKVLPPNVCVEAPSCPGQNPGNISYVPFPDFGTGQTYQTTDGDSYYHGLQTTLEKRFSGGTNFLATYTWSRCRSDGGDLLNGTAIGSYRAINVPGAGIKYDFGDCDFDIRQVVHFSGGYELPFGNGKQYFSGATGFANQLVSGWSTQWIATVEGGQPITLGCHQRVAADAGCYDFTIPGISRHGSGAPDHFLNAAAFIQPCAPPGTVQQQPARCINVPLNSLALLGGTASQVSGPGIGRLDFSLFKQFRLTERYRLEFRSEFFNILNHPTFNAPGFGGNGVVAIPGSTDFLDKAFGRIGSTRFAPNDPRQIQFALKLYY